MIFSAIALLSMGFRFGYCLSSNDIANDIANVANSLAPTQYPWGQSLEDRQNEILKSLRRDISLDVLMDNLPREGMTDQEPLYFKNAEGSEFSCRAHEEKGVDVSRRNISTSEALSRLKHSCLAFPVDWWSYEWCYQGEVKQYHIIPSRRGAPKRKPEWSLGVFDSYDVQFDADGMPTELIEYYSGGQKCDENGDLRSSEVHVRCCSKDQGDSRRPSQIPPDQYSDFPDRKREYSLVEFAQKLQTVCLTKPESWWSYDVCFGAPKAMSPSELKALQKAQREANEHSLPAPPPPFTSGARQYRVSNVVSQDGNAVRHAQILDAEFGLGAPPLELYADAGALAQAVRSAKPHAVSGLIEKGLPALHLEFEGGKPCDIENVARGSTMEIVCGARDMIEDIIEDRTCHYVFKITLRALCHVPGFAPAKKKIGQIKCHDESDFWQAEEEEQGVSERETEQEYASEAESNAVKYIDEYTIEVAELAEYNEFLKNAIKAEEEKADGFDDSEDTGQQHEWEFEEEVEGDGSV